MRQNNVGSGSELSKDHPEEGQTAYTRTEAPNLLEDDGVGGKEEIKEAVDECHVDTQEEYNRFCDEKAQRTAEVLGNEFAKVHFDFFLLGVNTPIECSSTES